MDTLDRLVALIREFAEKASVPASEAAQAVVRAVSLECLGNLAFGAFVILISLPIFLWAVITNDDWEDDVLRIMAAIVSGFSVFIILAWLFIDGGNVLACIAEPLGYTLKRLVLR